MSDFNLLVFAIAFLASAAITGVMRAYARRANLLDVPNQRSSHEVATPSGGGLGIVIVFLAAVSLMAAQAQIEGDAVIAFLLGGGLIAGIGFIDDHSHVSAKWRFMVQILAVSLAVYLLGGLPVLQLGSSALELGLAGDVALVVLIVWFTNAFNFMDGIDGIAASEAICIAGGAAILNYATNDPSVVLLGVLASASLGFLVWNWAPAKIFMGDVGSAFLGFTLIAIAIYTSRAGNVPIWSWLILAGVFIIDATITLVVRIWNRENWLSAHRSHAYQRASRHYKSHAIVTAVVIAINILWLFPVAFLAFTAPEKGWWLTVVAWLPLTITALRFGAGRPDQV